MILHCRASPNQSFGPPQLMRLPDLLSLWTRMSRTVLLIKGRSRIRPPEVAPHWKDVFASFSSMCWNPKLRFTLKVEIRDINDSARRPKGKTGIPICHRTSSTFKATGYSGSITLDKVTSYFCPGLRCLQWIQWCNIRNKFSWVQSQCSLINTLCQCLDINQPGSSCHLCHLELKGR